MRVAFAAIRCGGRAAYLAELPEKERREFTTKLNDNVAFNKGFECAMWCNAQIDGEDRIAALKAGLKDRDPRASQTVLIHG